MSLLNIVMHDQPCHLMENIISCYYKTNGEWNHAQSKTVGDYLQQLNEIMEPSFNQFINDLLAMSQNDPDAVRIINLIDSGRSGSGTVREVIIAIGRFIFSMQPSATCSHNVCIGTCFSWAISGEAISSGIEETSWFNLTISEIAKCAGIRLGKYEITQKSNASVLGKMYCRGSGRREITDVLRTRLAMSESEVKEFIKEAKANNGNYPLKLYSCKTNRGNDLVTNITFVSEGSVYYIDGFQVIFGCEIQVSTKEGFENFPDHIIYENARAKMDALKSAQINVYSPNIGPPSETTEVELKPTNKKVKYWSDCSNFKFYWDHEPAILETSLQGQLNGLSIFVEDQGWGNIKIIIGLLRVIDNDVYDEVSRATMNEDMRGARIPLMSEGISCSTGCFVEEGSFVLVVFGEQVSSHQLRRAIAIVE